MSQSNDLNFQRKKPEKEQIKSKRIIRKEIIKIRAKSIKF